MLDAIIGRRVADVDPEVVAFKSLAFLADDAARLGRFLNRLNIEPSHLRSAAEAPGFFFRALDYIVGHQWLAIGFADYAGVGPETVVQTRDALRPRSTPIMAGSRNG